MDRVPSFDQPTMDKIPSFDPISDFRVNDNIQSSYTLSPQSNTSYYMTWASGTPFVVSQSDPSTPGTNQKWDFIYPTTLSDGTNTTAIEIPKSTSVSFYLAVDSSSNIYQRTSPDYCCVWTQATSSGVSTFLHNVYNTYLGCDSSGNLTMVSSVGSNCQWTLTATSGRYYFSVTPVSGTTYYMQSSYDGHTVLTSSSYNSTDLSYKWGTVALGKSTNFPPIITSISPNNSSPLQYLKSNGDGTLSITQTRSKAIWWVGHQRVWKDPSGTYSSFVYAFQSVNGGYLIANSDNSTMGETTGSATPAHAAGLSTNGIFNLTSVSSFARPMNPPEEDQQLQISVEILQELQIIEEEAENSIPEKFAPEFPNSKLSQSSD